MRKILNKIKIIIWVLLFSTSLSIPSDISLSHALQKVSEGDAVKIQSEKEKRAMERSRKKALEEWKKRKKAMERARKKARTQWEKKKRTKERARKKKGWEELRRVRELAAASELAQLEKEKAELAKLNLKLEKEKLTLERERIKEEEEKRELEKRKVALAEKEQEARKLAASRELARLEKEKIREEREERQLEKRRIALAEKEQKAKEFARASELAQLEKEKAELAKLNLKLEKEKLTLERERLKEEEEKRELEKRKVALAEKEQKMQELATTRELAQLEREKLRKEREEREELAQLEREKLRKEREEGEAEKRRIALSEQQEQDEKRAEARELAWIEKEKIKKEKKRKKMLGEIVEGLLEKDMLTLDECIDVAMERHIQLKVAKKQLKLARFRLFEAKRNLGPTVTAKWENSEGRVNERMYTGEKFVLEGKQPIFYGGELVFSVGQAKVNLEIVENDYDRIKNDLILQVKKAYYTLDKAKKALAIQEKLQNRAKTLFDMVKAGYEAAVIPQIEFLKISSQYNQTSFQAISAREDISVARLLLQQAMGIEEEFEIAGIKDPEIIKLNLEDCFNLAFLNRPEIRISQLSVEYFRYEKKIRQARVNWPRVDFLGSYGNTEEDYVKDDIGEGKDPRDLGPEWYFGTKISMPIWGSTFGYSYTEEEWQPVVQTTKGTEAKTRLMTFSLFDRLGDVSGAKEADVEYMRSLDEINKRRQEITLEVKETFFKYRKAVLLMDVARSKVEFQTKQVEILEIRRELGEALYSDVVEEMIKLAEEEFSYTQAISDYYISIASLNKAVGIDGYFKI